MTTNEQEISCPHCGHSISIDDALTRQITLKIENNFTEKQKVLAAATAEKEEKILEDRSDIERQKKQFEQEQSQFHKRVSDALATEKKILEQKLRSEIKTEIIEENKEETSLLKNQLEEQTIKRKEAQKNELELRQKAKKLEEDKESWDIEKQRQIDEERSKISENVAKKAGELSKQTIEQKDREIEKKDQKMNALQSQLDEMQRKMVQGSQKAQGELSELKLEEVLKNEFPSDDISRVPIGIRGADIIQKVLNRFGHECGQILWESKDAKWKEDWIDKLKDNQRTIRAEIAVIISSDLPKEIKNGFEFRDGVWICEVRLAVALATALRKNLESIHEERERSVGKNEKMEMLYGYLTGNEFKQRVEAIVEAFTKMKEGTEKEKRAFEKIWTEREKLLTTIIKNTSGMYGDLSGLATMPQILALELEDTSNLQKAEPEKEIPTLFEIKDSEQQN